MRTQDVSERRAAELAHSSNKTQGEDVSNFGLFKPEARKKKACLIATRVIHGYDGKSLPLPCAMLRIFESKRATFVQATPEDLYDEEDELSDHPAGHLRLNSGNLCFVAKCLVTSDEAFAIVKERYDTTEAAKVEKVMRAEERTSVAATKKMNLRADAVTVFFGKEVIQGIRSVKLVGLLAVVQEVYQAEYA